MNFSTALIFAFVVVAFTKPLHRGSSSFSSEDDSKHKRHHHKHGHQHHTIHPRRSTSTTTTSTVYEQPSTQAPIVTTSDRIATEGVPVTTSIAGIITESEPITRAETEASTKLFPASTSIAAEIVTNVVTVEEGVVPAVSTQAVVLRTDASVAEFDAGFALTTKEVNEQ
ncbi:unnamed protein product [Cylicocyclus nassatus]|uniref:Uncharacterized protein n=1 Tax=Cylicocyclus nassatus TaxID=53992 RepID=A0AA36DSD3_CYLNA|nr:unnamed protein product [Cylicocyclus nassatus]